MMCGKHVKSSKFNVEKSQCYGCLETDSESRDIDYSMNAPTIFDNAAGIFFLILGIIILVVAIYSWHLVFSPVENEQMSFKEWATLIYISVGGIITVVFAISILKCKE